MKTREDYIKELEWFFYECEAAMGIKSTYGAFIEACKYSSKERLYDTSAVKDVIEMKSFAELCQNNTTAYDILAATQKNRKVLKNYQQLSAQDKEVLEAYYEERQFDSDLAKAFGPGLGLIPLTSFGQEFCKLLLRESNQNFTIEFRKNRVKIRKEVDKLYNRAIDNYIAAAKGETK